MFSESTLRNFNDLSFRYHDASEGDYVFEDLDLHVPAGQRVGLVGRSGSGKKLSQAGGTYESLWDRQTGAFLEAE